jgi:hypothetical protein
MEDADMTEEELNQAKFELDRERFEFEKEIAVRERRFLYRNSATVITAALSLAALAVSISQVWVAHIAKQREIEVTQLQKEKELKLEELREDRKWKYDTLQFVSSNKDAVFAGNDSERKRIRDVMTVTFPVEILDKLFSDLEERGKSPEEKATWSEGQKEVDRKVIASSDMTAGTDLPSNILNKDELVKQLTSSERRNVSTGLIGMYKQNKKAVVDALIDAILPESDKNSYRNNLYIVYTLGRIPDGWEGSDKQAGQIAELTRTRNYSDATFKQWVDKTSQSHRKTSGQP